VQVLFSADWHIKLGAKSIPADWAANRFRTLFKEIGRVEQLCDLHIIGGDIFDRVPVMSELELYFEFISQVRKPTIIYPGNHEALKKDTTFLTHLKQATNTLNPLVVIKDDYYSLDAFDIDIIPYNKLKHFVDNHKTLEFKNRILCTHVRGEIPPHVKPEIPLELLERWPLVLAGDLHSYSNSQRNILYPGSPASTSFHRNMTPSGVLLVDTETLEHQWLELTTPQLIRKSAKVGDTLESDPYHLVVYELEGDISELAGVELNAQVDRRISTKPTADVGMMFASDMLLVDEVAEYLRYVLGVSEDTVSKAIQVFLDHERHIL
jgi:hypothetical protein